jgi:hypothetical protein
MPELGPYGSVRGARSNARPYRDQRWILAYDGLSANDPGRVKTRSVLFVGGVSGDPGGIVRLGAANSAELVRADA